MRVVRFFFLSRKVPEVIEDSGDALNLLWVATQPYLRDGLAGPAAPTIARSVISLMHAFLTKGGPSAGQALVESGAVAPAIHVRNACVIVCVWFCICFLFGHFVLGR